jgi:hypothetical protein
LHGFAKLGLVRGDLRPKPKRISGLSISLQ